MEMLKLGINGDATPVVNELQDFFDYRSLGDIGARCEQPGDAADHQRDRIRVLCDTQRGSPHLAVDALTVERYGDYLDHPLSL